MAAEEAQELEITIVSAKHLKNVNWRKGDLRPYATFWFTPTNRRTTKTDESNSTKPLWNEHFLLPLTCSPSFAVLNLEIHHDHKPPPPYPKSLVGTLHLSLKDLPDPQNYKMIRTYEITRPSGRPNGKIRLKLAFPERAVTSPVIPEHVRLQGAWFEYTGPNEPLKMHLLHPLPPVPPEDSYPWMPPRKSKDKASASEIKELEADEKAMEQLPKNRWYCRLKKFLHVSNKNRKGPTDPLVEGLLM